MDLNEIAVFIRVVEFGSFTKAAHALGMPNSTVSSKVSELEKRLGVSLIKRTTRKLFVTTEGQTFFEKCVKSLDEIKSAEAEISESQKEPTGSLKITAPIEFGSVLLPTVLSAFSDQYPKVFVEVSLSDRTVDLIAEGFDLAVRASELKDSSFKSKKLGQVYFAPFASSSYLKKNPSPKNPKDLMNHSCLPFEPLGTSDWTLYSAGSKVKVPIRGKIIANELSLLKKLAVDGVGIALLPNFLCFPEVNSGKLVRILPAWRSQIRPVSFVFGGHKISSSKIQAFIRIAEPIISQKLREFEI